MDDQTFRHAMGKFATGVTVIVTETDGEVHGMTANAFMSVSLDPKLIIVSIDKRARILEKMNEAQTFSVNFLRKDQIDYSKIFAGQIKEKREVSFTRLQNLPVIEDALASIACTVHNVHDEGDHILFVGNVLDITVNDGDPLLFYSGRYREMKELS